jgi:hypothetical protein
VTIGFNILGNIKMELGLINGTSNIKIRIKCKCENNLVVEVILTNQGIRMDNG